MDAVVKACDTVGITNNFKFGPGPVGGDDGLGLGEKKQFKGWCLW